MSKRTVKIEKLVLTGRAMINFQLENLIYNKCQSKICATASVVKLDKLSWKSVRGQSSSTWKFFESFAYLHVKHKLMFEIYEYVSIHMQFHFCSVEERNKFT